MKMYEIAWLGQDGSVHRGGIKAPIATVGKWIEEHSEADPTTLYMAVPANEEAITLEEFLNIYSVENGEVA